MYVVKIIIVWLFGATGLFKPFGGLLYSDLSHLVKNAQVVLCSMYVEPYGLYGFQIKKWFRQLSGVVVFGLCVSLRWWGGSKKKWTTNAAFLRTVGGFYCYFCIKTFLQIIHYHPTSKSFVCYLLFLHK